MKTDLFQSCGDWWVFQICWNIECSTLAASWFRIWNSSVEVPSPPLALFVVLLLKVHLTLDSRVSLSRLVITPSWFSRSWKSFFEYFFCVFLPSLFNIFSLCYVCTTSILYCAHLCMKCVIGVSNFLEEISSLSHFITSSVSWHWSLTKVFYHSLLFFRILLSDGYIFPFSFAFHFSSFHSYL